MDQTGEDEELKMQVLCATTVGIMKSFQIWPDHMTFRARIKIVLCLLFLYHVPITSLGHLFHFYDSDFDKFADVLLEDLTFMWSGLMGFITQMSYLQFHLGHKKLLRNLGDFRYYDKPYNIDKYNKTMNFWNMVAVVLYYTSAFFIWLYTVSVDCSGIVEDGKCGFIVPAYLPLPHYYGKWRKYYSTFHLISGYSVVILIHTISWLIMTYCVYLVSFSMQLQEMIKMVPVLPDRKLRHGHVAKCVQYHYKVISLWRNLTDIIMPMTYIHMLGTPLGIALNTYHLLKTHTLVSALHLIIWFVSLLFTCSISQHLMHQSGVLRDVTYSSMPWDGDCITQKDMMIIVKSCEKELCIPLGKFGSFNNAVFMGMMKSIYSYITIIYR